MKVLRSVLAVLALAGAAAAGFILYYEVHDFRPSLPQIETIYVHMDPEDRDPPNNVLNFVERAERRTWIGFASGKLLGELRGPMQMGAWHYHSFMLELMLRWHFSQAQMMALYCHYLPYEEGSGFSKAANFYFGKQPDALSLEELATIVAVGRSPRMNSPKIYPERSQEAVRRLLLDYQKAQ